MATDKRTKRTFWTYNQQDYPTFPDEGDTWYRSPNGYYYHNNRWYDFNESQLPLNIILGSPLMFSTKTRNPATFDTSDGTLWSWGENLYGAIGNNTTTDQSSPVSVLGDNNFVRVAGSYTMMALDSDGSAWSWGRNDFGQLGINSTNNQSSPVSVVGNHSFSQLMVGAVHSLGLKEDGSIWSWGYNAYGQLGTGNLNYRSSPVSVLPPYGSGDWRINSSEGTTNCSISTDSNTNMQTGVTARLDINQTSGSCTKTIAGLTSNQTYYIQVRVTSDETNWGIENSITVSCGTATASVSQSEGTSVINVGYGYATANGSGEITMSATASSASGFDNPTKPVYALSIRGVEDFSNVIQVAGGESHSAALKANGSVWAWGRNHYGQLGINNMNFQSSPISVLGDHSFIQIMCADHTMGLKADGSVWSWGPNYYGQLGDNSTSNKSSPLSVLGGHSFIWISGGSSHSLALKSDGSAWSWGRNDFGRLGINSTSHQSSPVSVVGNHSFIQVSGGQSHSFALKRDGSVWAWGYNGNGRLGDNSTVDKSSPVSVVRLFN